MDVNQVIGFLSQCKDKDKDVLIVCPPKKQLWESGIDSGPVLGVVGVEENEDTVTISTAIDDEGGQENRSNVCPTCGGKGVVNNPGAGSCDSPWMTCPKCNGAGTIG